MKLNATCSAGAVLVYFDRGQTFINLNVGQRVINAKGDIQLTCVSPLLYPSEIDRLLAAVSSSAAKIYVDSCWNFCKVEVGANKINGFTKTTLELKVTLVYNTGIAFVSAPPVPEVSDLDILRSIRGANPQGNLATLWSEAVDPTSWPGVGWEGQKVTYLYFSGNDLVYLDRMPELAFLDWLEFEKVSTDTGLNSLDFSGFLRLRYLKINHSGFSVSGLSLPTNSYFKFLVMDGAQGVNLSLSAQPSLEGFSLTNCAISNLDLTGCNNLQGINLEASAIEDRLIFSSLPALTQFEALNSNLIAGFDFSLMPLLQYFGAQGTEITGVSAINHAHISQIQVANTRIMSLDVHGSTVATINASGCSDCITVNVQGCSNLYQLTLSNTSVGTIDTYGCSGLSFLTADNCSALEYLNNLPSSLSYLHIDDAFNIGELDLSQCSALTSLNARRSKIDGIQFPVHPSLITLNISDNNLPDIQTLTSKGAINIYDFRNNFFDATEIARLEGLGFSDAYILPQNP